MQSSKLCLNNLVILRRKDRIKKCLNKSVFERAGWVQNGKHALKRDSAKPSRWGQWKGQVSDVKKDSHFRENTGSENKV